MVCRRGSGKIQVPLLATIRFYPLLVTRRVLCRRGVEMVSLHVKRIVAVCSNDF